MRKPKLAMWKDYVEEKPIHIAPVELVKLSLSCLRHPRHDEAYTSHLHYAPRNRILQKGIKDPASWILSKANYTSCFI